jgi:hypothetical protein
MQKRRTQSALCDGQTFLIVPAHDSFMRDCWHVYHDKAGNLCGLGIRRCLPQAIKLIREHVGRPEAEVRLS